MIEECNPESGIHHPPSKKPTSLTPTILSQFIRLGACRRFLHLQLHPDTTRELESRYGARPRPLSPLLERAGRRFEQTVIATLAAQHRVIDLDGQSCAATVAALREVGREPVILTQAALEGQIAGWAFRGNADLIEAFRDRQDRLHVLIADIKSSREERLEHRVQVAAYALLLQDVSQRADLPIARIVGAVVHRNDVRAFRTLHDPDLQFDLGEVRQFVLGLLDGPDAPLIEALHADLDDVPFALGARCDGCFFNEVCLPRAAERADLALIPGVGRAARSALAAHDLRDLYALADLKTLDERGRLTPNPAHVERLAMLSRDPVLAPHVDHLIARARAILKRFDSTITAPRALPDRHLAPLPSRDAYPQLIELILDFQADDISGGVYLAAALVRGPAGERLIARMSHHPPALPVEADLLREFAGELESAIRDLTTHEAPPLHLTVYDRRAQRVALEACTRHESQHALLGALATWLQEQPQVRRATCARLQEIIRAQRNLKLTCDSLYAVASEVWNGGTRFEWRTPTHDFTRLFREGIFDNVRRFVREGDRLRAASPIDATVLRLEAASRFGSAIPDQYAYAIWEGSNAQPSRDDVLAFAAHRLRALSHLLAVCTERERGLDVPLLPLAQLPGAAGPTDLRRALITFMELEHVATLADLLAHVRLPIERRVLTGRTALLEAIAVADRPPTARFRFVSLPGGSVQPRFKVGDWVVLNENDGRGPWEILQGRLAIITAMTDETIELELTAMTKGGEFKLNHDSKLQVQLRCRYTLDEMADDLLGDKVRAALDQLDSNPLARWLEAADRDQGAGVEGQPAIVDRPSSTLSADAVRRAANALIGLSQGAPPTAAQTEVIAGGAALPLRLVQGPPGSGKSRTLGLAVVARLVAAAASGRALRVAVTAKTHSAAQVALDSIARAWLVWQTTQEGVLPLLADLPIVKLGGDRTAPRDEGVGWADPRRSAKELRALTDGACVIGGTPGGLSALLDTTRRGSRWTGLFDLLVIDEASQMSLPEGLLAASALAPHGQLIVVGDHRQMPPIIMHQWAAVTGRLAQWQPERSLFKWLLDAGAPVVALEESFRLHRDHAAFLQDAIYHADGIRFHSRRTALLPPRRWDDPLVDAALRYDAPLVVIEHSERESRQANEFESRLVTELARACLELGLDGRDGVGVVVPHRAQKALLRSRLPELADADAIDTVERFQGGERDVIIVACTASDPDYVMAEAEFLLDPQRLNVALSRARKKLIVVAAATVFGTLPTDLDVFQRAALWKRLKAHVVSHLLWAGARDGYPVRVMGPPAER